MKLKIIIALGKQILLFTIVIALFNLLLSNLITYRIAAADAASTSDKSLRYQRALATNKLNPTRRRMVARVRGGSTEVAFDRCTQTIEIISTTHTHTTTVITII